MAHSDYLADALTRIRNGQMAKHEFVILNASNAVNNVLRVLKDEGYILSYQKFEARKGVNLLKVDLKYYKGSPVIQELKKVSKPGRRNYSGVDALYRPYGGLGVAVISTSKGVLSDDEARKSNVGGEVLCTVY